MDHDGGKITFENSVPILRVQNLAASLQYYVETLGFSIDWQTETMASVSRNGAGVMLCEGAQGQPGTWVWFGVSDAGALYEEYKRKGAAIRQEPLNFSWAYEMRIEDPDGHVLRFGSEPLEDHPFQDHLA